MSFHFRCPHCNAKLEAEDDWVGLETSCPQCNQNITIAPATPPEKPKYKRSIFYFRTLKILYR